MMNRLPEIEDRPYTGVKATNEGAPNYEAIENRTPENGFLLSCEICDKNAVLIDVYREEKKIRVSSALRSFVINSSNLEDIIAAFKEKYFDFIHQYLIRFDGLDGYCPECDKVYCYGHWRLRPIFDDDFYDYTLGECPEGHERMVDD